MHENSALPFVVALDDSDDPGDVIDALLLGAFVADAQPFARSRSLSRLRPDAALAPPGTAARWSFETEGRRLTLVIGDGWTLRSIRERDNSGEVLVTAATAELANEVLEAATDGAQVPARDEDDAVEVVFWHRNRCGGAGRSERELSIEPWPRIRRNNATSTAAALDQLMALEPERLQGRLLLLHGPPGTGKTTVLRAVATRGAGGVAWRPSSILNSSSTPRSTCSMSCSATTTRMSAPEGAGVCSFWRTATNSSEPTPNAPAVKPLRAS